MPVSRILSWAEPAVPVIRGLVRLDSLIDAKSLPEESAGRRGPASGEESVKNCRSSRSFRWRGRAGARRRAPARPRAACRTHLGPT
ncbi:hypothetical protein EVAR_8958_1 [Eumeta japonica]|uniref:Uncharacterized protein n=1 Tax=Eumeta variegata TaxID=151549 RepID=A0A4C1U1T9_EUMVA|nr:hypothetical protein EVAR_8958_1 [Eumeta japonica]